jgi:murein DD-endopeptidase MepM/ murein hydrolase activator NlpD
LFGIEYADITPDFGDPRGGGTRFHEGEDFLAPKGAPIVSPTEAIVIRTGDGDSSGKYVYTANPGGETFRYMHLDTIADIRAGDRLDAGDFIGTVGDTGNAPDGVYHLHFETRDDKNVAKDPYPRLTETFSLKEKMSFLENLFANTKKDEIYAEFLVKTYSQEFREALREGYKLPKVITEVLEDTGAVSDGNALEQLEVVLKSIPGILTLDLKEEDSGSAVALLQMYLMYMHDGKAIDALRLSGPTGYYGARTTSALREYQERKDIKTTGVYDALTRKEMVGEATLSIRL